MEQFIAKISHQIEVSRMYNPDFTNDFCLKLNPDDWHNLLEWSNTHEKQLAVIFRKVSPDGLRLLNFPIFLDPALKPGEFDFFRIVELDQ